MDVTLIIAIIITVLLTIFAFLKEYKEYNDSFWIIKPRDKDSMLTSLRKIQKSLEYDKKTVKWRRVFLASIISIILIFGLGHSKLPTTKNLYYTFFSFLVLFM